MGALPDAGARLAAHPERMEPIEQLNTVMPTLTDLVAGVKEDQLADPTPCARWAVRDLLGHLAGGLTSATSALREGTPVDTTPRPELLGDDRGTAFTGVVERLNTAVGRRGALETMVTLPFGVLPAEVLVRFLAFDMTVHSWDVAMSTNQLFVPDDDVVAEAAAFAHGAIAPEMRDGDTFAAALSAPDGTSALERLVAFAGRRSLG
ncbi:MAG: hypothetical protein QOG87_2644 [Actinomycetota bacterium]